MTGTWVAPIQGRKVATMLSIRLLVLSLAVACVLPACGNRHSDRGPLEQAGHDVDHAAQHAEHDVNHAVDEAQGEVDESDPHH